MAVEIEGFDLGSRPRRFSEELQARTDTRIMREATDRDDAAQLFPAPIIDDPFENLCQRDAVERIVGMVWIGWHGRLAFERIGGGRAGCEWISGGSNNVIDSPKPDAQAKEFST